MRSETSALGVKKIAIIAVLPAIALASCGKSENASQNQTQNNTPANNTQNANTSANNQALNQNINNQVTNTAWITTKNFNLTYTLPDGRPLTFKWNLEIDAGVIKLVNFPDYDLVNGKTYEVQFAQKMQKDLVWKQIKWLQYDGMSWASLTTKAFNDFLNTINK